jgi:MFS transporter, DHA3 family, macrolide efflux protein
MHASDPTTSAPAEAMSVRAVLRIPDYRRLFAGQVVSDVGDGITVLLLLLVINDLTGSTAALALMAIAEAVPQFTVGLVAGVYVDRWNRRTVMLAADLVRAVILVGVAVVATAELVPLLYVLAVAQSSASTFFRPARGALLPRIVPTAGLPAANSLAQGSQIVGMVIGAGIAGLIFDAFGSGAVGFLIDAGTFLVSFAFVSRLAPGLGAIAATTAATHGRIGASLLEGLAIVRGSRALGGSLVAAAVSMLGLGAVNVLFVPLLIGDLRVAPSWMAGIELAQTAAMLLAAGIVPFLARRLAPTTIISLGLVGIGVGIGLLSGVTEVWHVLGVLFLVGWMVTPLQAMLQTIVQTTATDATRGRVVSVLQASMSTASVVSMAVGGVLGDLIGIRAVYLAAAGIVLVAALISVVLFRGIPRASVATPAGA